MGDAEDNNTRLYHMAVLLICVMFSIDYRKGPEFKPPTGQHDYACLVKYIYKNADSLGIDKTKICAGGLSGGC